jgi:hypothetical protein
MPQLYLCDFRSKAAGILHIHIFASWRGQKKCWDQSTKVCNQSRGVARGSAITLAFEYTNLFVCKNCILERVIMVHYLQLWLQLELEPPPAQSQPKQLKRAFTERESESASTLEIARQMQLFISSKHTPSLFASCLRHKTHHHHVAYSIISQLHFYFAQKFSSNFYMINHLFWTRYYQIVKIASGYFWVDMFWIKNRVKSNKKKNQRGVALYRKCIFLVKAQFYSLLNNKKNWSEWPHYQVEIYYNDKLLFSKQTKIIQFQFCVLDWRK